MRKNKIKPRRPEKPSAVPCYLFKNSDLYVTLPHARKSHFLCRAGWSHFYLDVAAVCAHIRIRNHFVLGTELRNPLRRHLVNFMLWTAAVSLRRSLCNAKGWNCLIQCWVPKLHPFAYKCPKFMFLYGRAVLHCVQILYFLCPFCWWTHTPFRRLRCLNFAFVDISIHVPMDTCKLCSSCLDLNLFEFHFPWVWSTKNSRAYYRRCCGFYCVTHVWGVILKKAVDV